MPLRTTLPNWLCARPKRAYRMKPISTNWSSFSENGASNDASSGSCASLACPTRRPSAPWIWTPSHRHCACNSSASKAGRSGSESANIVAIGKPGVGKSHALCAVAYELAQAGHPVLWTATSTLVQRLLAAKRDLRLPQELAKLDRFACVFLDDIGYVQ